MPWPLIKLLPTRTHFRFVRLAPVAAVLSTLAIIASIVSFSTLHLRLGIDFQGGTLMEIATPGPAPLAALRSDLAKIGLEDPQVQGFGSPNSALLRFKPPAGENAVQAVERIKGELVKMAPGIQFKKVEVVGPKVSGELFQQGFLALGIALALMLIYIWFRFQLQFGLGAVLAVFHDVFLTLGLLSALQIEFSMTSIAALLTVIGYSMNEKVITFDRLRENLRKYRKTPLRDVIDLSENERLSRTLITGSTALLALVGALFLGGSTLFPLVLTMAFGILIGTYSSVYVALPVILLWGVRRNDEPEPAPKAPAAGVRRTVPRP
jgi:preprotein translocase subunit SecF